MKRIICLAIFICVLMTACSSKPEIQTVEKTKIVQVPITQIVTEEVTRIVECEPLVVEVEVTREVKVTQQIEVTRVVEKEITREVLVKPTITPTPTEMDPSVAFSMNYAGELEQDGIKVELARIVFMHRDALKPGSFDGNTNFDGQEYVGEIIWQITNNTQVNIKWNFDDINFRVNERQIKLYDYLFDTFNGSPNDEIFPGSTIIGGVWFGIGSIKPDEIKSAALLMSSPYNAETYYDVSGNFVITVDLSGEHKWYPLPDELK